MLARLRFRRSLSVVLGTVVVLGAVLGSGGLGNRAPTTFGGEIDPATPATTTTIATVNISAEFEWGGIFDGATGNVYLAVQTPVGGCASGAVTVISGSSLQVITSITVGSDPTEPVLDPLSGSLFLGSNAGCSNLTIVDPSALTASSVGTSPYAAFTLTPIWDPETNDMYVPQTELENFSSQVAEFGGAFDHPIRVIPIGAEGWVGAADSTSGDLYFANLNAPDAIEVSPARGGPVANVSLSEKIGSLTFDPSNGDFYAAASDANSVVVFSASTNAQVAVIPVGADPSSPVLDPENGMMFVANGGSNNVSVIATNNNTVVATVPSIPSPGTPLYDAATGDMYFPTTWASQDDSNVICVVSTSHPTVGGAIPVGVSPSTPILDSATGDLFVPSYFDGGTQLGVSVVGPAPPTGSTSCEPPAGPTSTGFWTAVLLGVVAFVAIFAALVLLFRRSSKRPGPPT